MIFSALCRTFQALVSLSLTLSLVACQNIPPPQPPIVEPAIPVFVYGAYPNVDAALDAMRSKADQKIAQITLTAPHLYEPLLLVIPTQEEVERARPGYFVNMAEFRNFTLGAQEITFDSYAKAFRKNALFREVSTLRSNSVEPDEFLGNRYKLWFVPIDGFWVLASTKGGEERFKLAPENDEPDITAMLIKVKTALANLPP